MTTTKNKKQTKSTYSPSVNIIRDSDKPLSYIPTPNAQLVFGQLAKDYNLGIRSFNIVGAYGTGKSSFIRALDKSINKQGDYFDAEGHFNDIATFEFLPFVGEFNSLVDNFARRFGINTKRSFNTQDIIDKIDAHYLKLSESEKGLVIVIDEFGKFLEYAAKKDPEFELYFIQQLAEYVNDTDKEIIFLTTLHQDFNAYSLDLSRTQRFEWDKVKGRLQELTFNEPIEQLLYLASERISEKQEVTKEPSQFNDLFDTIKKAKAFPLRDYFNKEIARKLLPFDILSASVLTLSLQRYGQNERSLFSFIESNDHLGLQDHDIKSDPYFNVSNVYNYLLHNYHSLLTTKYNPHYAQWAAIRSAIERAESVMDETAADASKLIKTIGLLNIYSTASARLDKKFLSAYGKYALGIKNPEKIIDKLETHKIIRYINYQHKYNIFEGTDLDIELAIDEAGNLIERVSDVVTHLNEHFDFPYIPAKAAYYEKGTPRFFEFKLSEIPINEAPEGEIDGFINLIFSENTDQEEVRDQSEKTDEAILYGWYENTSGIRDLIYDIEKTKKAREIHIDDKVAKRELNGIIQHNTRLLNHYVWGSLFDDNSPVKWYFRGKKIRIDDFKTFNRQLSDICNTIYEKTPVFKSELLNKTHISGAIATARKQLFKQLFEFSEKENLGFDEKKFPPEKTIYLSLLKTTGIHRKANTGFVLGEPREPSFNELWKTCINFLDSTKANKRTLNELTDILSSGPFKLKKGFLNFWLPLFLYIKQNDFALYGSNGYIPYLSIETLELILKKPKDFAVKAFDVDGVKLEVFNKYRGLLEQTTESNPTNETFIETIRPFLVFYRDLPAYAKITNRLSKEALALRKAIEQSEDPEKTFFEDFPGAIGYTIVQLQKDEKNLEDYVEKLQRGIREIRTCYDELLNRVEQFLLDSYIGEAMEFPEYKDKLQGRYKNLKTHVLLPRQKVFFQRLASPLDDRKSWLSSLGQAVVDKSLDQISDDEEKQLYEKFGDLIHELDNLCDLSQEDIDPEKEEIFKFEITNFVEGLQKSLVRYPKNKTKQMSRIENEFKTKLTNDKQLNIHILAKLLQDQLKK